MTYKALDQLSLLLFEGLYLRLREVLLVGLEVRLYVRNALICELLLTHVDGEVVL